MKITVDKQVLFTALSRVQSVIPSRPSIAVLGHYLLEVSDGQLVITGTDLEQGVTVQVDVVVESEGVITAPAKKLLNSVRYLRDGDVSLYNDGNMLVIEQPGVTSTRVQSLDAGQYPREDQLQPGREFVFSSTSLRKMFDKTSYSASNEDNKGPMKGLLLTVTDGSLACVATDGRRLAFIETILSADSSLDGDVILPLKAVSYLGKILEDDQEVRIHFGETKAVFTTPGMTFRTMLLEGNFPNYNQVIPNGFNYEINIPRVDLVKALEQVEQVLEKENSISLSVEGSEILVVAREGGDTSEAHMTGRYEGEPVTVSYNVDFLLDALKRLECNEVILRFNDLYAPTGIYGDEGFVCVIMPLRKKK